MPQASLDSRRRLVVVTAGALILALAACTPMPAPPGTTAPGGDSATPLATTAWSASTEPSGIQSPDLIPGVDFLTTPHWSAPLALTVPDSGAAGVGDGIVVIFTKWRDQAADPVAQAVDVNTMTGLWRRDIPGKWVLTGPSSVVLWPSQSGSIEVLDPRTGQTTATAPVSATDESVALGYGYLVTANTTTDTLCIRRVSDPGRCVWTQSGLPTGEFPASMIGNGRWLVTTHGVFDLASGEPAPFGADASFVEPGEPYVGSGATAVTYVGDDPVLRETYDWSAGMVKTYQRWDTAGDSATSASITTGSGLCLGTTIAVTDAGDATTVAGYQWQTGQLVWHADGAYCMGIVGTKAIIYEGGIAAVDVSTGTVAWRSGPDDTFTTAAGNRVAFVASGGQLVGRDTSTPDFAALWSIAVPSSEPELLIAVFDGRLVAFSSATSRLWRLEA